MGNEGEDLRIAEPIRIGEPPIQLVLESPVPGTWGGYNVQIHLRGPNLDAVGWMLIEYTGSPVDLFREMADEWAGWEGEKRWGDGSGTVELAAHHDHVGHVTLTVRLRDEPLANWSLRADIRLEPGQLAKLAEDVSRLLPDRPMHEEARSR